MAQKIKKTVKLVVSLTIGIGLLWWVQKDLTYEQKNEIVSYSKNVSAYWIILILCIGFIACVIRALRWKMLLKPMGYNPKFHLLLSSIFIMYLGNTAFPRLGEVLRCSILAKYDEVPIEKSIGSMLIERLVDILMLGVVTLLAFTFQFHKFIEIYEHYKIESAHKAQEIPSYVWVFCMILLLIIVLFMRKTSLISKLKERLIGFWEGLKSIQQVEQKGLFILYSVLIYVCYFSAVYFYFFAFEETSNLGFGGALICLFTGTLAVGLTQGGIGAYQVLVTKAMSLYGVSEVIGLTYSWTAWFFQTAFLMIGGLIGWVYLSIKYSKKKL